MRWLLPSAIACLACCRFGSALRSRTAGPEGQIELASGVTMEALESGPPQTGVTRRAHTEWWTLDPPKDRKTGMDLPQCCMHDECWRPAETAFRVPSYVGPAPANFTWDPNQLKQALTGKRVVLIGDSLTRQWSMTLACYLTGAVPENYWSKVGMQEVDDLLGNITQLRSPPYLLPYVEDKGTFEMARLRLEDVNAEIITYMRHNFWPHIAEGMLAMHARTKDQRADLLIINQGVHFNSPSNGGLMSLGEDLVGYMDICKSEGLHCILRESSAQHFWYVDSEVQSGLYHPGKERQCISGIYKEGQEFYYDSSAEWRRDELLHALERVGQPDSVMPLFEATMPLTFAHHRDDCTHYLQDMEYWEPWHAGLFGLLENL
uniref:SGNH domain-containing protein n=1 Tax=Alexandrium catenella TaxID=2925 RepID=A0A7S1W460_ALECA|mmetsp:Transcript_38398/g.103989  ORF Transcript_38398/g.103989 Transcript_38398/m.103989 type:complete len:376 (+) Transcript_38398:77-1204(+)